MLEKYYEILKISEGDRILVAGLDSLAKALYIAGKAKKNGLNVGVHALIDPNSSMLSEDSAIEYAKDNLKEEYKLMKDSANSITFSTGDLKTYGSKSVFNKAVVEIEDLPILPDVLSSIDKITIGEKRVLLDLSFKLLRKIRVVTKKLFGKKEELLSLRQFLTGLGFQINFYDAVGQRLLCCLNARPFSSKADISLLSLEEFGEQIRKEVMDYLIYVKTGVQFCIVSDNKEYMYFVQDSSKGENEPIRVNFIFLDGTASWESEAKIQSRSYSIIVLPNTENFKKELESKEVLIISKERAFEFYGENVEPY